MPRLLATLMVVAIAAHLIAAPLRAQTPDSPYVVTYLDVRPPARQMCSRLIAQYVHATRAEAGNVAADAFKDLSRSNRFVIVEIWRDRASFAGHEKLSHTLTFRQQLRGIHRSPEDQRVGRGFALDPAPAPAGPQALYVVTHVDVPGGQREAAEKLLQPLAEAMRRVPGHLRYEVYQQDEPHTNHFTVVAGWKDRAAFEAWDDSAPWRQFMEALAPLLGAPYDERLYRRIER